MRNFKKIAPRICAVLAFVILFESVARFAYEGWTTFSLASKRERRIWHRWPFGLAICTCPVYPKYS